MRLLTADVLVIGAGPAGLSAATEAAVRGAHVVVVDEASTAGGQLVKQIHKFFGSARHGAGIRGMNLACSLRDAALAAGVELRQETRAVGFLDDVVVLCHRGEQLVRAKPTLGVIAVGATEKATAFPGWTLPGVVTAGAAQTFVNLHRVAVGERVLVAGSGNVGLVIAYQLVQAGSTVVGVTDVRPEIGGWGVHASKIRRLGVPFFLETRILEARGNGRVSEAVLETASSGGRTTVVEADAICLAVGMSPRVRLLQQLGCKVAFSPALGGFVPVHDSRMRTSVPDWLVAGDAAGVEDAAVAMDEGRLAGLEAALQLDLVTRTEFDKAREEVSRSLAELRSGPLGAQRRSAKEGLARDDVIRRGT
jgi:thioredoxin reductase